jgi:hypothetical protein
MRKVAGETDTMPRKTPSPRGVLRTIRQNVHTLANHVNSLIVRMGEVVRRLEELEHRVAELERLELERTERERRRTVATYCGRCNCITMHAPGGPCLDCERQAVRFQETVSPDGTRRVEWQEKGSENPPSDPQ